MKQMPLPNGVLRVLERFEEHNIAAYAVGGCVRDYLRGVVPHDFDIATEAEPKDVCLLFADLHVVPTGLKHGTVTVISDGLPLEITTFRVDGDYFDARHPENVRFTRSFREDCARRDFTVNAMGYSMKEGIVDAYGGRRDLDARLIRTVGEPNRRFGEDALRILRALRFSSVLDFDIEEETARAAREMAPSLRMVSVERIYEELCKLLCGRRAFEVLSDFRAVFAEILPEIAPCFDFEQKNPHHIYDVYRHTLHLFQHLPQDKTLRLAALLHDVGKPACFTLDESGVGHFYSHAHVSAELAEKVLLRFHADRETIQRVTLLVKHHGDALPTDKYGMRRLLARRGEQFIFDLIALKRADTLAQSPCCKDRLPALDEAEALCHALLLEKPCLTVRDLKVDGTDVMAHGVPRGREVGRILAALLDAVMKENLPNERDALLDALKAVIDN